MVKNTTGGNRSKGLARKNENQTFKKLRMSECEEERYAVVRKIFGGSRCEVFCDDNIMRNAIIRGKFSGKNKRNNMISSGTILLVGLREWSGSRKEKECDVLEVYGVFEVDQLKQRPNFPTDFLNESIREIFGDSKAASKNDDFDITDSESIHFENTNPEPIILMETGEEISIDDI